MSSHSASATGAVWTYGLIVARTCNSCGTTFMLKIPSSEVWKVALRARRAR